MRIGRHTVTVTARRDAVRWVGWRWHVARASENFEDAMRRQGEPVTRAHGKRTLTVGVALVPTCVLVVEVKTAFV